VDINDLVEEAVDLAKHGAPDGKEVEFFLDLDDDTGRAEVLPAEISRVVLNLVGNSIYAARKGADGDGEQTPHVTTATARRNGSILITVSDNGIGMNEEVQKKIFQPFFTTKPTGEGTGLGLSLCWDIVVNGHNGTIEVESEEGKGATFMVNLPVG
jgi:signal transduction histidine kinase